MHSYYVIGTFLIAQFFKGIPVSGMLHLFHYFQPLWKQRNSKYQIQYYPARVGASLGKFIFLSREMEEIPSGSATYTAIIIHL